MLRWRWFDLRGYFQVSAKNDAPHETARSKTTYVSAVRGNIGLMSWAFSLFICGLAILITVQSLLMWCSRLDNYPFSTPRLWEFFLGFGVYGACAAVVGAITLLVVTVLNLRFDKESASVAVALALNKTMGGDGSVVMCTPQQLHTPMQIGDTPWCNLDVFGGNYFPGDAHLTFDVNSRSSAVFAFAVSLKHYPRFIDHTCRSAHVGPRLHLYCFLPQFIGAGIAVAVIVFALFCAANGVQLFLWRRSIERSRMYRIRLDDLEYDKEKATKSS